MHSVVCQELRNVADPAAVLPEPQNKFHIAAIKKLLVLISTQPVINLFLHKESRMNHIANPAEAQDVIVIASFLSTENLPAHSVHINDIAKKCVPIRVFGEGLRNFFKRSFAVTIIGIKNRDNISRRALDSFVHRMIMTTVSFRYPLQMRIGEQKIDGAVGGTA